ncbi:right-handed parallel beta-helix repeat-containing protein [Candidatus Riflebacteria bacterium]
MRLKSSVILLLLFFLIFKGCAGIDPPMGDVTGFVLDSTGQPISGALVSTDFENRTVQSSETGSYFLENLPFGPIKVSATKNGYEEQTLSVDVLTQKTISQVNFSLSPQTFKIVNLKVDKITATNITLSFSTTVATKALARYGVDTLLGKVTNEEHSFYSRHQILISNLALETTYYIQVEARDAKNYKQVSSIFTVTTSGVTDDPGPPDTPRKVEAFFEASGQVRIVWNPSMDQDLSGYRVFRSESKTGNFELLAKNLVTKGRENYLDAGLTPGAKYFYRITAVDLSFNESGYSEIAEILVPGRLNKNITWTRSNSPYTLNADLIIPANYALTIEPGVDIYVKSSDLLNLASESSRIEIINQGILSVRGSEQSLITFQSAEVDSQRDSWDGITIEQTSTANLTDFQYFSISNCRTALKINNSSADFRAGKLILCEKGIQILNGSDILIENNKFENNDADIIAENASSLTISLNTFSDSSQGISLFNSKDAKVSDNSFTDFALFAIKSNDTTSNTIIRNNIISSLSGTGLIVSGGNPDIQYNTIDSIRAITIEAGKPGISNCILAGARNRGFVGIDNLATGTLNPLPSYSDIFNFEFLVRNSATGSNILHKDPVFMGGSPYDYHLKVDTFNDDIRKGSSDNSQMGAFGGK